MNNPNMRPPNFTNQNQENLPHYPGMPVNEPNEEIYYQRASVSEEKRKELGNGLIMAGFICIIVAIILFILMR